MDIERNVLNLGQCLQTHLEAALPDHKISESYKYAVLPAGKLFRPLLVIAMANDNGLTSDLKIDSNHAYLASAVEIHHAYTLVHDDLPCMDDDDFRRGRPSLHKKYNEWIAVLAGDGLLNISYELLTNIHSTNTVEVIKYFSESLGPKGLIHGQVLDLSEEMNESIEKLLLTHKLKTARLIQVSLVGSYLLSNPTKKRTDSEVKEVETLGEDLGIAFQLIDDLSELAESKLSQHEAAVNPWPKQSGLCTEELLQRLKRIEAVCSELKLQNTKQVIDIYYKKMKKIIDAGEDNLLENIGTTSFRESGLVPIMSFF